MEMKELRICNNKIRKCTPEGDHAFRIDLCSNRS
jgi:hypothetical protein